MAKKSRKPPIETGNLEFLIYLRSNEMPLHAQAALISKSCGLTFSGEVLIYSLSMMKDQAKTATDLELSNMALYLFQLCCTCQILGVKYDFFVTEDLAKRMDGLPSLYARCWGAFFEESKSVMHHI